METGSLTPLSALHFVVVNETRQRRRGPDLSSFRSVDHCGPTCVRERTLQEHWSGRLAAVRSEALPAHRDTDMQGKFQRNNSNRRKEPSEVIFGELQPPPL
mmetsp:Transcript_37565/g.56034  ORF Transcript_37565/g.56034 Transcript_37565/m.56034 type:complete len:101 (-) Transcript_37565:9-311(-)